MQEHLVNFNKLILLLQHGHLQLLCKILTIFLKHKQKNPKNIVAYLQVMKKSQILSENMLKYCIFVHNYAQNGKIVLADNLNDFMAHLLSHVPLLIEKYSENEINVNKQTTKRPKSKSPCRSCNQSPMNSTRSQQNFICKEIYLLTHIIKPYISYLMKLFSSHAQYIDLINKKIKIQKHQAWMLINYLKIICSIANSFITIGRYFIASYGNLIAFLIRTLVKDINKIMKVLSNLVSLQKTEIYNSIILGNSYQSSANQLIAMLYEIAKINDELFKLYYGKYFIKFLKDLSQPNWINPNSTQFDRLYGLNKIDNVENKNKTIKKRSVSTGIISANNAARKK